VGNKILGATAPYIIHVPADRYSHIGTVMSKGRTTPLSVIALYDTKKGSLQVMARRQAAVFLPWGVRSTNDERRFLSFGKAASFLFAHSLFQKA
jgi:hypothetical protein